MPPEKQEVFRSLQGWAAESLLPLLKPVDDCWQPTDFLPDSSSDAFEHEVRELRSRAAALPDDYFVVLVGDMVTEEARILSDAAATAAAAASASSARTHSIHLHHTLAAPWQQ
jgi:hypothetical protein